MNPAIEWVNPCTLGQTVGGDVKLELKSSFRVEYMFGDNYTYNCTGVYGFTLHSKILFMVFDEVHSCTCQKFGFLFYRLSAILKGKLTSFQHFLWMAMSTCLKNGNDWICAHWGKICKWMWKAIHISDERSLHLALYWWSYIYISAGHLTLEIDVCHCTVSRSVVCFLCIL